MLYADTQSFLPDDCLFKVDRMSMAHGLEVRVPFLDGELVEFVARLPFDLKIRALTSKYILKKTFKSYLPRKIFKQRKQGFTIPISAWLRKDLGDVVQKLLLSNRFVNRGYFNKKFIQSMLEAHRSGQQDMGHRLWGLAVFEVWARLYLDKKSTSKPNFSLEEMID
jgi:asparagine synthase (glutamine-hydrolysing)